MTGLIKRRLKNQKSEEKSSGGDGGSASADDSMPLCQENQAMSPFH